MKNTYKFYIVSKFGNENKELLESAHELGFRKIKKMEEYPILWIETDLTESEIFKVLENWIFDKKEEKLFKKKIDSNYVEVTYHFGVKDPEAEEIEHLLSEIGITCRVKRGKRFVWYGNIKQKEIDYISKRVFYNPTIEICEREINKVFFDVPEWNFDTEKIMITDLNKEELLRLSKEKHLYLLEEEMEVIRDYYRKLDREPTLIELETFAQMWSEHCVHKTFKGEITYGKKKIILLREIQRVSFKNKKKFCQVLFKDNAGIFYFDNNISISCKVETHNHPSALEPYGGASTGIGGVIRDILGAGLGGKPIASIDVFCVAPLEIPDKEIPEAVMHPKRILKGIAKGVEEYGNRMGIPTVTGAVIFEEEYLTNPLVYCGTIGVIPSKFVNKKVEKGDIILIAGGKTGKDGIHGATFSSAELDEKSEEIHLSSVQIGDPITEKKVMDAILEARDKELFNFITDVGGGGLSSAITENVYPYGAKVYLDRVPLKYKGLSPREIWISESQERMVLFAKKRNVKKLKKIFEKYQSEITPIGEVGNKGKLELVYRGKVVGEIDIKFIHNKRPGIKRRTKSFKIKEKKYIPSLLSLEEMREIGLKLIGAPNIRSKEEIIRRYDHEVQGRTIQKPLDGIRSYSPQDGAILKPLRDSKKALGIAVGITPSYSRLSPFYQAANAVDEVVRTLVSKGAEPSKIVLLDNFCFANPEDAEVLSEIVDSVLGACFAAEGFKIPFISGKDSMYNEFIIGKKRYKILPTLLVTGLGIIDDENLIPYGFFKIPGNPVYIIGNTNIYEIGGSEYLRILKKLRKGLVPKVYPKRFLKIYKKLNKAIKKRTIISSHDISQGGLFVSICEMSFAMNKGVLINLQRIKRPDLFLFSESAGRILVEVDREREREFLNIFSKGEVKKIGEVIENGKIIIKSFIGIIEYSIKELFEVYSKNIYSRV